LRSKRTGKTYTRSKPYRFTPAIIRKDSVTSTVSWHWADRRLQGQRSATRATQTHFRAIRLSSQEMQITLLSSNAKDSPLKKSQISENGPSVVPITGWKTTCWWQYSGAKMGTPDVSRWAAYLGLSKKKRLTACRKIDPGLSCGDTGDTHETDGSGAENAR